MAECDLSSPFLRPTPAADNAVGRPGHEKAALSRAPEAGPRDSAVVSHECHLFRAGVAVKRSFFHEGRRRRRNPKRGRGGEADRFCSIEVVSLSLSRFRSAICICAFALRPGRGEASLPPPPTAFLLPSPPPTAAKCLKYLTGFALFLGLCSVC